MSYKRGIIAAITELNDPTGSSALAIKQHMQANLPKGKQWMNATFLAVLKKMINDGDVAVENIQNRSSYKLSFKLELEKYNQLDEGFSVEELRQRIDGISSEMCHCKTKQVRGVAIPHNLVRCVLERTYFLCGSKNISDELIQCVLEYFPEGASFEIDRGNRLWFHFDGLEFEESSTAFMLHFACENKLCPGSVIETLVAKNPAALRHLAHIDCGINARDVLTNNFDDLEMGDQDDGYFAGLPLHYYLARGANIDLDTVRLMVNEYPQSLTSGFLMPVDIYLTNPSIQFGVFQFLVETNPASLGQLSFNCVCGNCSIDTRVIQLIVSAAPHLAREGMDKLCRNDSLLGNTSLEILALLIEADPDSLLVTNQNGNLPIHEAIYGGRSLQFCKMLVDACPESTRIQSSRWGPQQIGLPLHIAARSGAVDIAKYLFDVEPKSVYVGGRGNFPFFQAEGRRGRRICHCSVAATSFLEDQWNWALKAKDTDSLIVQDDNGEVPLHQALRNNASLGSVKLLTGGNPSSLDLANNERNYPLHLACRGGNGAVVKHLLGMQMPFVSKVNIDKKLPIHLLLESGQNRVDDGNPEYLEAIWLLLRAHPETIMN